MELGWSDDANMTDESDGEKMPISSLPSLQQQDTVQGKDQRPARPLMRRGSSASGTSLSGKRRRAVFAPTLTEVVHDQATLLARDVNGIVGILSQEVVRLLQRDDPGHFLRPFTDSVRDDFPIALAKLNAVAMSSTSGFAYSALNALVGYLKHTLRSDPNLPSYAAILSTISLLAPNVSEISLRDLRKNKAEAVLLPASIHEEHGGFNLHTPWRDGLLDVQTAQLLVLNECLKANPREVYLVKKMLSNLPIQPSIGHLPFARAWLVLITTLFGTVNRKYNDRAELRHFLVNVAGILRTHGTTDVLVASHAIHVFMLCAARFRRVFASMGFSTIMRSVYEVYANGNSAVQDCVEYAARSFYRIHADSFVYQTCVVIAEGEYDPAAAYTLLSSLSIGNTTTSGIASGIRGLNEKEEIDAVVQMLSGPEIALSEIGTDRAERQAAHLATVALEEKLFSKENIIKLFITVIAANPCAKRSGNFLRLFAGIILHIQDQASKELLREGVEALGGVIVKARTGDEAATAAFHPGEDEASSDWTDARRDYVFLVESFARAGGQLGAGATKITLEIVLDLLRKQPEAIGPAASSILRELANTHMGSNRAVHFLKDIAPLFRMFIGVVDFSGVLDSITELIQRSAFEVHLDLTEVVVEQYVEPAVCFLATASEDAMAFMIPLRSSIVRLLATAVFLRGDALGALKRHPPNASLLASLVMPLVLLLEPPLDIDRDMVYNALWIRLLHYILGPTRRIRAQKVSASPQSTAATEILTLQIVKVICLRAPNALSSVKGLWTYIANHLLNAVTEADGKFYEPGTTQPQPRIVDWMMWSLFELLTLHASPLMISFRLRIQTSLYAIQHAASRSRPSTADGKSRTSVSPQLLSGRARMPSARSPSVAFHSRVLSNASPENLGHSRIPSAGRLTPEFVGHPRMPSNHLTPILGHARSVSGGSSAGIGGNGPRPSFTDLSARRASRPVFDAFPSPSPGMRFRFPSSAPIRSLNTKEKGTGGGAIIHLLGAPSQVLSATSSAFPTLAPRVSMAEEAVRDIRVKNEELAKGARRAVRVCMIVLGWDWEMEEEDEPVRVWSVHDALVSGVIAALASGV